MRDFWLRQKLEESQCSHLKKTRWSIIGSDGMITNWTQPREIKLPHEISMRKNQWRVQSQYLYILSSSSPLYFYRIFFVKVQNWTRHCNEQKSVVRELNFARLWSLKRGLTIWLLIFTLSVSYLVIRLLMLPLLFFVDLQTKIDYNWIFWSSGIRN